MTSSLDESGVEQFLDAGAVLPWLAGGGWRGSLRRGIEAALGVSRVREIFVHASRQAEPAEALLEGFRLTLDAVGVVERIPATGPVVVCANHPFGGADALSLIALCLRRRGDFRILANEVAASAPGIGSWVLPLSILGGRDAARRNAVSLRTSLDHLRSGGLLAVFPAGAVSTWRPEAGRVADGEWSSHVSSLALKAQAPVLPVRFFGENPPWFHLAGALHPMCRTVLLPRMLLAAGGQEVTCRAGCLASPDELAAEENPSAMLRRRMDSVAAP